MANRGISAMLLGLCMVLTTASAAEVGGVELPPTIKMQQTDHSLQLNGAGIRYKFIFKIYVGALYLTQPLDSAEAILSDSGPKRVLMHFLYDKVDQKALTDAWQEGFAANHDPQTMQQLQPRIDQFSGLFGDALGGDRVWLDYLPGKGTRISINGVEKGMIPGDDFYKGLLRIWIGDEPVTRDLKQAMLAQE